MECGFFLISNCEIHGIQHYQMHFLSLHNVLGLLPVLADEQSKITSCGALRCHAENIIETGGTFDVIHRQIGEKGRTE